MTVTVLDHPLALDHLTTLRRKDTNLPQFRMSLHQASLCLSFEAARHLTLSTNAIETPVAPAIGHSLTSIPLLVPILRAGLGMLRAAQELLPLAETAFIGISKDGQSAKRSIYMSTLPDDLTGRSVWILDPMLATGLTLERVHVELVQRGCDDLTYLCLLGSTAGVEYFNKLAPDAHLVVAAVDSELNDIAFIVPGLGDAGDRQFGP